MTPVQILALVAVLAVIALTYLPLHAIKLPAASKGKPSVLRQVESIVAVRESNTDPAIVNACNALLQALLQVKA